MTSNRSIDARADHKHDSGHRPGYHPEELHAYASMLRQHSNDDGGRDARYHNSILLTAAKPNPPITIAINPINATDPTLASMPMDRINTPAPIRSAHITNESRLNVLFMLRS
jgi:hypothetical protein